MEFGRRVASERELEKSSFVSLSNASKILSIFLFLKLPYIYLFNFITKLMICSSTVVGLTRSHSRSHSRLAFDETGNFILYPTILGIKVVNVVTNKCVRIIGSSETIRFVTIALAQGMRNCFGFTVVLK